MARAAAKHVDLDTDEIGCRQDVNVHVLTRKRHQDLRDYFTSPTKSPPSRTTTTITPQSSKRQCQGSRDPVWKTTAESISPNTTTEATIPGLAILENFISIDEEKNLVEFLDNQTWRTDLSRRVIHYGGTYCIMAPRSATPAEKKQIESIIHKADPIPKDLDDLITRMTDNPYNLYPTEQKPEFCIVNSYTDNQGISAHVENFRFAEPVVGLTLLNGDWMRFHELVKPDDGSVRSGKAKDAQRTGKKIDVWLPRRGLVVMNGDARSKWQHEIVRCKKGRVGVGWRRVSLTFRTVFKKIDVMN